METGIRYEHVWRVMNASKPVGHGSLRVLPHAARSRLMLSAAQTGTGEVPPCLKCSGFLEYRLSFARKEFSPFGILGVPVAGQPDDGNPPGVPDSRINLHTGIEERHFLYRTDDLDVPPEILPLEFLVLFPPQGGTGRTDV